MIFLKLIGGGMVFTSGAYALVITLVLIAMAGDMKINWRRVGREYLLTGSGVAVGLLLIKLAY